MVGLLKLLVLFVLLDFIDCNAKFHALPYNDDDYSVKNNSRHSSIRKKYIFETWEEYFINERYDYSDDETDSILLNPSFIIRDNSNSLGNFI